MQQKAPVWQGFCRQEVAECLLCLKSGTNSAGMSDNLSLPPQGSLPDKNWFNTLFEMKNFKGRVRSLQSKSIGTGQIGSNIRFTFEFDGDPGDAPLSLVGKFPSDKELSRQTASVEGLGHYRRETYFYQHFKELSDRIAPSALYADYDPGTENFAIIMEDMAPGVQGNQLEGTTFEHAEWVMDIAAELHAAHWQDSSLEQIDWLQGTEAAPQSPFGPEMIAMLWEGFKERYADQISKEAVLIGDTINGEAREWATTYTGPKCLMHGDYRLDNMLFSASDAKKPLAVVDWQTVGLGCGAQDISYFIGAGFRRDERAAHEMALLKRWHDALTARGVTGYSLAEAQRDYRYFTFSGFAVAFAAPMIVERTERGDEMFMTMIRRHVDQIMAHDALSLL